MTTRITQFENEKTRQTILKLEGTLLLPDAQVLEAACQDLCQNGTRVTVNLSGVGFVTDSAAEILCRLRKTCGVVLEGMHLFVQQVIEITDAALNNGDKKDGQS